jgi:hypothetical protein
MNYENENYAWQNYEINHNAGGTRENEMKDKRLPIVKKLSSRMRR